MEDVRKLVPRTPPEGLLEWTAERHKELEQDGLLIETEWAEDYRLEVILDEWAQRKKVRAIRATCSACKESGLLWRGQDGRGEWGFIHPGTWTEGEGGEVCADGDKTTCPWCGEPVIVRRKADVRKKGWFVAAERHVMSASVLGKDRLLTLTGWTVQRRITAAAERQLVAIPAEAYVFSADDCAQLMGWVNSYSGTAGYFVQYSRSWRQPGDWRERWGEEENIYGLTPELVASSCLPHCKLVEYMANRIPMGRRYPVAYLRLYQRHPNVESILLHGLPQVLDELIIEQTDGADWSKKNRKAELELPEIRWEETRSAQMLGLNRDELVTARKRGWGVLFWRLFTRAKAAGERLTDADITHAFYLGDEDILELVGRGPVGKSMRYLLRQIEQVGVEPEDEDPQPEGVIDVSILLDYWRMAELVGRDLADPAVRWPENLLEAELFGYEKGSFTGASGKGKVGLLEVADGGTVLLDEIGELPLDLQPKLLRFLQQGTIYRVGGSTPKKLDVRIIAATNADLKQSVKEGRFRDDLYYRISVFPILVPPLRMRGDDVRKIAEHYFHIYCEKYNKSVVIPEGLYQAFEDYDWPGNVRELQNMVEYLVICCDDSEEIDPILLQSMFAQESASNVFLADTTLYEMRCQFEKGVIGKTLRHASSLREAAKTLGLAPSSLLRKTQKYGLDVPALLRTKNEKQN